MVLKVTVDVDSDEFHSVGPGYNHLWSTARKEGTTEQLVLAFIDTVQQISAKLKKHTASASEESAAARFLVDMGTVLIETMPRDNATERSDGLEDNASTAQLPDNDSSQGLPSPTCSASSEDTLDQHTDVEFAPGGNEPQTQGTSGTSNASWEIEHDEKDALQEHASDPKVSPLTSSSPRQSPSKRHTRSSKKISPITVGEKNDNEEEILKPCRKSRRIPPAKRSLDECNEEDSLDSGEIKDSDENDDLFEQLEQETQRTPKGRGYRARAPIKGWKSKESPKISHPFMCEICGAGYVRKTLLRDHMCSKHGYTKEDSDSAVAKVYGNRGCRVKKFNVPDKLFYPDVVDPDETTDDTSKGNSDLKPKPMCPKCGSVFDSITDAQIHFEMECAKRPLHCDICGSDFRSIYGYKVHMEVHANKKKGVEFTCKTCGKVMYHQYMLSQHEATHSLDFVCDICGRGFAQKCLLTRHMNYHTKEKVFACTQCPKEYYSAHKLRYHIYQSHEESSQLACHICGKVIREMSMKLHLKNIHSESDNVECDICHKVLKRQSYLEGHIKEVHQGAGKFPCTWPECDKSFVRKRSLVAHLGMHNNVRRFTCEICSKKFRTKNHLFNHTNWHKGVRPHQCEMCEKSFLTKGNLTKHLVTHKNKPNAVSPKPINVSIKSEAETLSIVSSNENQNLPHAVSQETQAPTFPYVQVFEVAPDGAPHGVPQGTHVVSQDAPPQVAPHGIVPQGAFHSVHDVASNVSQVIHVAQQPQQPQVVNQDSLTVFFTM